MARRARLNVVGGVFHLVSRFARDEPWLDRPGARDAYLNAIGVALGQSDVQVLAYCLMSNHVHLVVIQGEHSLERFTKSVHVSFARWVRAHRGRSQAPGAVFAERPRTLLVDREQYLPELVRYVHNNPVRAGVSRFARSSAWSSHPAYVGKASAPKWLRLEHVLDRFGKTPTSAAPQFDAFVDAGRKQPRRPDLSGAANHAEARALGRGLSDGHRLSEGILGTNRFVTRVQKNKQRVQAALLDHAVEHRSGAAKTPRLREVAKATRDLLEFDAAELKAHPRSARSVAVKRLVTWVWVHGCQGHQIDVARAFGMTTGAVSRHYGHAIANAVAYDKQSSAVMALLRKQTRKRPASTHRLR